MTTTTGFQVWNQGVRIKMPKLQEVDGFCPKCFGRFALNAGKFIPVHCKFGEAARCPGSDAVVTPIKSKRTGR
jgi:hypothetical protein